MGTTTSDVEGWAGAPPSNSCSSRLSSTFASTLSVIASVLAPTTVSLGWFSASVSSAELSVLLTGRKSYRQYIRCIDSAPDNLVGPMGSQRYCVAPGRLRPKGPERSFDADSRVAQMTIIGMCRFSVENKDRCRFPSLTSIKACRVCSDTTWVAAVLFILSSVACKDIPSCVQYLFMLLRSLLSPLAWFDPLAEVANASPKPKNPTDAGREDRSRDASRELAEDDDNAFRRGTDTLTVVPRPWLLRSWTVPPSDLTI